MKKRFSIVLVLLCTFALAQGQSTTNNTEAGLKGLLQHTSVQLHAGTQGFGGSIHYSFSPKFAVRLGGTYGSILINQGLKFDNLSTDGKFTGDFSNIHLYGEYTALSWLRIVAGAGYLFRADAVAVMTPKESVTQGEVTLEPGEIGTLTTAVRYKKFAPYLGFGFGRGMPQKRFNVNFDLGLYYLSAPKVTMTGTGFLEGNERNNPILTENMKNYRYLPVLQINFKYRLSK
jgi:hypothetical protein